MIAAGVSRSSRPLEILGRDDVVAADHGAAGLVVLDARQAQPGGRIDDSRNRGRSRRAGHTASSASSRWRGRACSRPGGSRNWASRRARRRRSSGDHLQARRWLRRSAARKPVGRFVAGGLAHLLAEDRGVFEPMAVAIDDRMLQLRADLLGALVSAHAFLPEGDGRAPSSAGKRRRRGDLSQTQAGTVSPPIPARLGKAEARRPPALSPGLPPGPRSRCGTGPGAVSEDRGFDALDGYVLHYGKCNRT